MPVFALAAPGDSLIVLTSACLGIGMVGSCPADRLDYCGGRGDNEKQRNVNPSDYCIQAYRLFQFVRARPATSDDGCSERQEYQQRATDYKQIGACYVGDVWQTETNAESKCDQ